MGKYRPCPTCGATAETYLIPVWEDPHAYETTPPDYIGCTECGTMQEYENDE